MAPQAPMTPMLERPSPGLVSVDGRTYPLRAAHLRGRAEGGLALATLVQEFHNPHDEPLEVVYTMPLPADGAVLGYTITMGERIIRGEIEVREQAEARYRDALYQGRTAGLLEQDRAALMRAIRECIEKLARKPLQALRARLARGALQPDREIARQAGMTANTFFQNIVRARKQVAACLEGKGIPLREVMS